MIRPIALSPRRAELALTLFTAAVVVSIAFAAAGLTWRLAGHVDTGAVAAPPPAPRVVVADVAPALALAPFGRVGAGDEGAAPTGLAVVLRGIVYARPESLAIAYIASGSEAPRAYRVGEAVAGATIQSIGVRRVLLLNAGRVEALAFPDPLAAATAAAPGAAPAAPPPPAAPAPPPPAAAAAAAADPAAFLSRLDAQPAAGGYRIGANAPPGLRAGDVVAQVNGQALSSPEAAQAALARAGASGTAQIGIVRDGRPITLTIPVR